MESKTEYPPGHYPGAMYRETAFRPSEEKMTGRCIFCNMKFNMNEEVVVTTINKCRIIRQVMHDKNDGYDTTHLPGNPDDNIMVAHRICMLYNIETFINFLGLDETTTL